MIKITVPVIDDISTAYTDCFEGVAWCLDLGRLVEVWDDGSWKFVPPHEYSRYIDWSSE